MNKEEVIKKCREAIEVKKSVRETTNNALSHAIGLLEKNDGEYERGLKDAWELAQKIGNHPKNGGYDYDEMDAIFGSPIIGVVFDKYTYQEALAKVKEYEKREGEAAKPKLGDVVEVKGFDLRGVFRYTHKGIYLKETDTTHNILVNEGDIYILEKEYLESIEKTGEHVDIQGMLDKIGG